MDEAQRLADRVAIIAGGRIVAEGRPDELGDRESRPATISFRLPAGTTLDRLPAGLEPRARGDGEVTLTTRRPVEALNRLTGWALERSLDLDGLEVTSPEPRGRLPRAHGGDRAGARQLSASSLVLHQFRLRPEELLAQPGLGLLHRRPPADLPASSSRRSSATTRSRSSAGIKTTTYYVPAILTLAIVSATMQSVAIQLTVDRESGVLKRGRGTPLPAWVFFAGRAGNAIVISAADAGRRAGDRQADLRRRDPVGPPARRAGDAGGRRGQLLLSRDRAHGGDPERGRGAGDHQRHRAAAVLPLRRLHPRDRDPRGRPPVRRPVPDPALLRGVLRRLGPGDERRRVRVGAPRGRRRLGRRSGLVLAIRFFRWTPRGG